jgi:hypothetical protein
MTLQLRKKTVFLSFTFAILLHNKITIAQSSSDYIVTNRGDTVAAAIKSKKWDLTPQKIVASVNGTDKKYRPFDIRSFTAGNRTFISAYVKRDVSNHMPGTLDLDDEQPRFRNDSIFAELLIGGAKTITMGDVKLQGPKCLYRYKDPASKLHLYIAEKNQRLQPLIYKKFYTYKRSSSIKVMMTNEEYKKQLNVFLSKCDDISRYVNVTAYEDGQLLGLFIKYYQCTNQ